MNEKFIFVNIKAMVDKSHQIMNRIREQFKNVSQKVPTIGTNDPPPSKLFDKVPHFPQFPHGAGFVGANGHGIRQMDENSKPHFGMVGANGHGIRKIGNFIQKEKELSQKPRPRMVEKPYHPTKEEIEAHMKPKQFIGTTIGHMPVRQK
jgi:hypothetical protein